MKHIFSAIFSTAVFIASASGNPGGDVILPGPSPCLNDLCMAAPPPCPTGQVPVGEPGCYCGCRPICRQVCPTTTSPSVTCLPSETLISTSSTTQGCGECCIPACGTKCSPVVIPCIQTQQLVGVPGCWSCCPPLGSA